MNKQLKTELIKEAQQQLFDHPQDIFHDIAHHARVQMLAHELIHDESLVEINLDVIDIVCWWHDVELVDQEVVEGERVVNVTARYISQKCNKDSEVVFDAINFHEFGQSPQSQEGKVLQDADKLEILSLVRWMRAQDALATGEIDKKYVLQVAQDVKDNWLPKMLSRYHFDFSKKWHEEHEWKILKIIDEILVNSKT